MIVCGYADESFASNAAAAYRRRRQVTSLSVAGSPVQITRRIWPTPLRNSCREFVETPFRAPLPNLDEFYWQRVSLIPENCVAGDPPRTLIREVGFTLPARAFDSKGKNPTSISDFRDAEETPALCREAVSKETVLPTLAGDSHGNPQHSVRTNRDDHHQSQV